MSPAVSHRFPGLRCLCYTHCYIREDLIHNDLDAYLLSAHSTPDLPRRYPPLVSTRRPSPYHLEAWRSVRVVEGGQPVDEGRWRSLLMRRGCCTFLLHPDGVSPVLAILPTGAGSNRAKIAVKAVFACPYVTQFAGCGCPGVTDGLDGRLGRLPQWPRREDGPAARGP
jgi:hypothetical protein